MAEGQPSAYWPESAYEKGGRCPDHEIDGAGLRVGFPGQNRHSSAQARGAASGQIEPADAEVRMAASAPDLVTQRGSSAWRLLRL